MTVLLVVIAVSGAALAWTVMQTDEGPDELAEVPLMAAMFVAMVWHAHRRRADRGGPQARRVETSAARGGERSSAMPRHELRTPITVARGHAELIRGAETNSSAETPT